MQIHHCPRSRATRARRAAVLAAPLLAGALLAAPVAAVADSATPTPSQPQLSIAMDNGRTSVKAGQQLTYAITLTNLGQTAVKDLTLTQTLPPGATFGSADAAGRRSGNTVTWKVQVNKAAKATVHLSFTAPKSPPQELLRLATVACVHLTPKRPPLVCASDSDLLPAGAAAQVTASKAAPPSLLTGDRLPWLAGGAGVLAAGVLAALLIRRRRQA